MLTAAFKYWKSKPWISLGVGWFFIAIAPTSNVLVPINAVLYEHFLYMPMIGIVLIVVHLSLDWAQKRHFIPTLLKILGVILVLFCCVNIHRNLDWRTSIGFYEQLITYQPYDYRVVNNLGMEYANKGIYDKALATYLKAIALDLETLWPIIISPGPTAIQATLNWLWRIFRKLLPSTLILFSPTVPWLTFIGTWANGKNVKKVYCSTCA